MKNYWLSFLLLLWGLSGAGARVWRSGLSINVWVIDCRADYRTLLLSGPGFRNERPKYHGSAMLGNERTCR